LIRKEDRILERRQRKGEEQLLRERERELVGFIKIKIE